MQPPGHSHHNLPHRAPDGAKGGFYTNSASVLAQRSGSQRFRIWELPGNYQCSIVGTCLTLSELRALSRKLGLVFPDGMPIDYQIHGYFAKIGETSERPSRLLNKLLDKRHGRAIKQIRHMKTPEELKAHWKTAMENGDIPGPYWAISSHPGVTKELSDYMFGDVHMLSHLVGASNRADLKQLMELETKLGDIEKSHSEECLHYKNRLEQKDTRIEQLRTALEQAKRDAATPLAAPANSAGAFQAIEVKHLERELTRINNENSFRAKAISKHRRKQAALQNKITALEDENQLLANHLTNALAKNSGAGQDAPPGDLSGKSVLYVGGRPKALAHLRSLIENWNGQFLHHDGGIEKSLKELAGAVEKADMVVLPTNCVSHGAVHKLKQLCDRMMKPYIPLRTSGTGSLAAGLSQSLVKDDDLTPSCACCTSPDS